MAWAIESFRRLFFGAALKLFGFKLAPIAAYGISALWEDITVEILEQINRIKASFPKNVLGSHVMIRYRLAYFRADPPLLSKDPALALSSQQRKLSKLTLGSES